MKEIKYTGVFSKDLSDYNELIPKKAFKILNISFNSLLIIIAALVATSSYFSLVCSFTRLITLFTTLFAVTNYKVLDVIDHKKRAKIKKRLNNGLSVISDELLNEDVNITCDKIKNCEVEKVTVSKSVNHEIGETIEENTYFYMLDNDSKVRILKEVRNYLCKENEYKTSLHLLEDTDSEYISEVSTLRLTK